MRNIPWLGYIALLGGFLILLLWENNTLGKLEKAAQATAQQASDITAPLDVKRAGVQASQAYLGECRRARMIFKAGFLFFIVLPMSVVFPILLSEEEGGKARASAPAKKKTVNVLTMTLDDVDRGFAEESIELRPQTRLFVWSLGAYLVATAAFSVFPILWPEAYLQGGEFGGGTVRTALFFLACALMVFSGSGLAFPLRERFGEPRAIALRLGSGFAVLGVLALAVL